MSPSPARSKPPPKQLESLMNLTPDPPDDDDHMIIPEIYESEPETLEKREANITLPTALTTLLTRLNDKIEELTEKQARTDKIIEDLLKRVNNITNTQQKNNNIERTHQPDNLIQETHPLSFAEVTAKNPKTTGPVLPKRPPPELCQAQSQDNNRFKKYHIVICTKFGAPKPFEKTSPQTA
ncbi:hypothetical protein O181_088384 [Austropuccinia psidii MF-1]|uniref:Uncharacterized protein n=1 Tax=Austropuccinia psidii MF-1 TaxID=1389203 RepID=A0A9Q3IRJ0_9BASI|nr:hypothetical protein [Austropuccinia psidii MF-1]